MHFRDDGVRSAAITHGLTMTAAAICFAFCWFRAASGATPDRRDSRPGRRQRHLAALPSPPWADFAQPGFFLPSCSQDAGGRRPLMAMRRSR